MRGFYKALLLLGAASRPALSQTTTREWRDRTPAVVAETKCFVFHSDSLMNLHDFLVWRAMSTPTIDTRA